MKLPSPHKMVLTALACTAVLACGCDESDAQAAAAIRAEADQWRQKYEDMVDQNERLTARCLDAEARTDDLAAENAALADRAEEADDLRERARRAEERVVALEAQPAAAGPASPAGPETDASPNLPVPGVRGRLREMGMTLCDHSDYELARPALLSAYELGARDPELLHALAHAESATGDYAAAVAHYEATLDLLRDASDPALETKCLNNYAAALLRMGRPEEALSACERALALDGDYAPAWFNLGLLCARELDQPDRAVEALRKHVVLGGSRGRSARELILQIQAGQAGPAEGAAAE